MLGVFTNFKSTHPRWAMYMYPLMLVLLEIFMKYLLSIETGTIIGPSLSIVGASYVIPLIVKRPLTLKKIERLREKLKPSLYDELVPLYLSGDISYTDDEEEQVRDAAIAVTVGLTVL